jgi:hypothetical protein
MAALKGLAALPRLIDAVESLSDIATARMALERMENKNEDIEDIIAAQISIGALNIQYDTDAEFEIDYIDKQLGYFVGLSILGNWWGESGFNFVFNTCYDFSDIKNENNELLWNGLSIGFGVQINWNYS